MLPCTRGLARCIWTRGHVNRNLRFRINLYVANGYMTGICEGSENVRASCCPLRGHFGPKIDKETPLKNQQPVVGSLSRFLCGQNRRFLHGCPPSSVAGPRKLHGSLLLTACLCKLHCPAKIEPDTIASGSTSRHRTSVCLGASGAGKTLKPGTILHDSETTQGRAVQFAVMAVINMVEGGRSGRISRPPKAGGRAEATAK